MFQEREHASEFMKYQNMRGGRVVFQDIAKPFRRLSIWRRRSTW
jgi:ferritin